MKTGLPVVLTLILLTMGVFGVNKYMDQMSPVWRDNAIVQGQLDALVNAKAAQEEIVRAQYWTGFYQAALMIILFSGAGWGAVTIWAYYNKRREAWARPVDGIFALQPFKNGDVHWVVDPNKSPGGITGFNLHTGQVAELNNPVLGPDRQIDYAKTVQKTRTVAAANGGDNGIKYAAQAKLAAGAYDRDPKAIPLKEEPLALPLEPVNLLTLEEAYNASSYSNWALGQNQTTGDLFSYNPQSGKPLGILGATGSGKSTYTALLLMIYALKHKYRVVVLDGKGGQDWEMWAGYVEYLTLTHLNILELVDGFNAERLKRQEVLNENKVNNVWLLPKGVKLPRPTLVIVDEFGSVMSSLKLASSTQYNAVSEKLGILLSQVRATGIVFAFADQYPGLWPKGMLANLDNIAYKIGGMQGQAIGEYNLQTLKAGEFKASGEIFNAWETWGTAEKLINQLTYVKPNLLLPAMVTASGTVAGNVPERSGGGGVKAQKEALPTPSGTDRNVPERSGTSTPITPVEGTEPSGTGAERSGTGAEPSGTYPLKGLALTDKEKELVRNTFALEGRYKTTARILWGTPTPDRVKLIKELVGELLQ